MVFFLHVNNSDGSVNALHGRTRRGVPGLVRGLPDGDRVLWQPRSGRVCLYGTGLDTSSLIPRLNRVPATLAISACAVALVYLGALVWNAFDTVSAFLLILVVVCTPWMVICLMGFYYAHKRYRVADLQLFNLGKTGGVYWYTHGFNVRAFVAFIPAVFVGIMCINTTLWVGPWADAYKGIDLSFTSAAVISAVIYGVSPTAVPRAKPPWSGGDNGCRDRGHPACGRGRRRMNGRLNRQTRSTTSRQNAKERIENEHRG